MTRLILQSISKSYGATRVLSGIDLDIPSGASVAILGPSGCGKTTALRCIAGLEQVDGGSIAMDDRLVAGPGLHVPPERRGLAMVFQSYALWPHMDVAGNVAYPLRATGAPDVAARTQDALRAVRLDALATRRPSELSGGQQQRTALARALAAGPGLILMDEPLANLDMHLREEMRAEFRRLHAQTGATLVTVTHDQADALSLADLVVVMQAGRVVQCAPPQTVYARPASRAVASLIGRSALLTVADGRWRGRPVPGTEGHSGLAVVRPEDVALRPGDAVRIGARTYLGDRWLVRLDEAEGLEAYAPGAASLSEAVEVELQRGWPLRD